MIIIVRILIFLFEIWLKLKRLILILKINLFNLSQNIKRFKNLNPGIVLLFMLIVNVSAFQIKTKLISISQTFQL